MVELLPEEIKSLLFYWKTRHGKISIGKAVHTDGVETVFVFRLPTIGEFSAYRDLLSSAGYYASKELIQTCLLYPDEVPTSPEDISNLLTIILFASGFDDDFALLINPQVASSKIKLMEELEEKTNSIGDSDKISLIAVKRLLALGIDPGIAKNLTSYSLFEILNTQPEYEQETQQQHPMEQELPETRGADKKFQLTPEQLSGLAQQSSQRRTKEVYRQMQPLKRMLAGIPAKASPEQLKKYREVMEKAKKMGLKAGDQVNPEKDNLLFNNA